MGTKNVYEAGVDAGIMHFEGDEMREQQERCGAKGHTSEPWIRVRWDHETLLLFPAERCKQCKK